MNIQIEARILGDMCLNQIIPACIKYQNELISNISGLKALGFKKAEYQAQMELLSQITQRVNVIKKNVIDMIEERKKANKIADGHKKAKAYNKKVKPFFDTIRYEVDKLEIIVDDSEWPLPKYRELLFIR